VRQMPPMDTRLVDDEALALLRRWIADELTQPSPAATSGDSDPSHPSADGTTKENPR